MQSIEKYGMGQERTLNAFFKNAKIDIEKKTIGKSC
jgi:hypothetical protein